MCSERLRDKACKVVPLCKQFTTRNLSTEYRKVLITVSNIDKSQAFFCFIKLLVIRF